MAALRGYPNTQFVRFCVVGAGNTAVTFAGNAAGLALGFGYMAAAAGAFALGALNGYAFNRVWTFGAGRFRVDGLARYAVVQVFCLGLDLALLALLLGAAPLPKLLAQAFVLPPVTVAGFMANRRWTFGFRQ